ncbi:hypothetical protein BDQ17DRAFT_382195 [Cyathus striatus]|nr:hypothetical protein BDQ17DRAFT_382195 [Cyathus striatus]
MGFSLIAPHAFVLTCIDDNGSIELFTFSESALAPPTHIVSLELPQKSSKAELGSIAIHSGPLGSSTHPHPRPDTAVLVISPQYIAGVRFALYPFSIFVLNRTLLFFISRHQHGSVADRPLRWEEWSKDSTRIIPDLTRNTWLRYVHGQRIVFPPFGGGFSTQTLRILDFNVDCFEGNAIEPLHSSATHNLSVYRTTPTRTLRSHKSIISDDNVFQKRIVSKLPCISIDTQICSSVKFETFLIDQNHVVGMRLRKETGEVHLQIFCF